MHRTINKAKAEYIRNKRQRMGLSRSEFAVLLDLKVNGEQTVCEWEHGERPPTRAKWGKILVLPENAPFKFQGEARFTFIDLFAGIGGIRLPFQELGGKCVFTSEWDKFAQKTYATNFGELPSGDITQISASNIDDHDVLLAGFPCQAFSQAGLKKGFCDTRGTMFFEIQRILAEKRPKCFLLENVKQLKSHDKGKTLKTIINILTGQNIGNIPSNIPISQRAREAVSEKLNYWVDFKILRARDFGTPQIRERIFIVGFNKDYFKECDFSHIFEWPEPTMKRTCLGDILENSTELDAHYTISDRLWNSHQRRKKQHKLRGNGFGYGLFNKESPYVNTISARYYKDGSDILIDQSDIGKNPRMLTPRECARLQGFPDNFVIDVVSKGQAYKQFGNSVCMSVIRPLASSIISAVILAEGIERNEIAHPRKDLRLTNTQLTLRI